MTTEANRPANIVAKWYGGNPAHGYIHGVPTMDLDEEMWKRLPDNLKDEVRASDMYAVTEPTSTPAAAGQTQPASAPVTQTENVPEVPGEQAPKTP